MLTFCFQPFPILETSRLILKQITEKHAPRLHQIRSIPETLQYIPRPLSTGVDAAEQLIALMNEMTLKNDSITWGVFLKESEEKLVGTMGYYRSDQANHRSEIGYLLDPAYWRKGITHEAIQPAIRYGFEEMKLHTIEAVIHPKNIASRELLLKNGFVKEGLFRENTFFNGEYQDSEIYTLFEPTLL